jgi:hypothetical protein
LAVGVRVVTGRLLVLTHLQCYASGDRKCPIYLDEKAVQELMVRDNLSLADNQKKFLKSNPKAGSQSYACIVNCP